MLVNQRAQLLLTESLPGPGVSLEQLIADARSAAPQLKVIVIADGPAGGEARMDDVQRLLRKPFSLADLAKVVRVTLDRRARPNDGRAVS